MFDYVRENDVGDLGTLDTDGIDAHENTTSPNASYVHVQRGKGVSGDIKFRTSVVKAHQRHVDRSTEPGQNKLQ